MCARAPVRKVAPVSPGSALFGAAGATSSGLRTKLYVRCTTTAALHLWFVQQNAVSRHHKRPYNIHRSFVNFSAPPAPPSLEDHPA